MYSVDGVRGFWRGYIASTYFRTSFAWMFGSIEAMTRGFKQLDGTSYEVRRFAFALRRYESESLNESRSSVQESSTSWLADWVVSRSGSSRSQWII